MWKKILHKFVWKFFYKNLFEQNVIQIKIVYKFFVNKISARGVWVPETIRHPP